MNHLIAYRAARDKIVREFGQPIWKDRRPMNLAAKQLARLRAHLAAAMRDNQREKVRGAVESFALSLLRDR